MSTFCQAAFGEVFILQILGGRKSQHGVPKQIRVLPVIEAPCHFVEISTARPKYRINAKFAHFVDEYDKVMTENFAERFVDHRNIGLTPQRRKDR